MASKKAIKAAEELVVKYQAIVDGEYDMEPLWTASTFLHDVTGFGSTKSCTLCIAVEGDCDKCVWAECRGCLNKNYRDLRGAYSLGEVKEFLKTRIVMLETLIGVAKAKKRKKKGCVIT